MIVLQNVTAIRNNLKTIFKGSGGTAPYSYAVAPNGAGGTIDPVTGVYSAPQSLSDDPSKAIDTIIVTDSTPVTPVVAQAIISILDPLGLICDIIQSELGLADDQVFLWDQKFTLPNDSRLYVAVSVVSCKPFGNKVEHVDIAGTFKEVQSTNFYAILGIDICSRSTSALYRKEEVIMAMRSDYAQSQQEVNSFKVATLPTGFVNLSNMEGPAIPYRFNISVPIQYAVSKIKGVPYFDTFDNVGITTNT